MVFLGTFEFDLFLGFIGAIGQNSNNFTLDLAERAHSVGFRDFIDRLAHGIPRLSEMFLIYRKIYYDNCYKDNKKLCEKGGFLKLGLFFTSPPTPFRTQRGGKSFRAIKLYHFLVEIQQIGK